MAGTDDLRAWLRAGEESVADSRELLDAINVFPIADSDTGTNLHMTLAEGNRAVDRLDDDATLSEVVTAFTRGTLMGARGNSGVIVAQYMNAFLRELDARGGLDLADAAAIAAAFAAAATAAHDAVGDPVDGTILTVADAVAASAAQTARGAGDAREVVVQAVAAARVELARTNEVLEVAHEAGVVDAGAAGLVLQIEALAQTLGGGDQVDALPHVPWEVEPVPTSAGRTGGASGAFEVMFVALANVVEGPAGEGRQTLKSALKGIGDAVAVTGVDGLWQAHVHTARPELAVDVALRFSATQAVVRDIAASHDADRADAGVVALTTAPGLAAELGGAGAAVLVVPDPSFVEPLDLQRVVQDASDTRAVIAAGAPRLAAAMRGLPVSPELPALEFVDATTEAELVSAVAAAAMAGEVADLATPMRAAVARTRTATSTPDALADDLERIVRKDTELVTVILGRGISRRVTEGAIARLAMTAPHVEVQVFEGRQATPPVILGAEASA